MNMEKNKAGACQQKAISNMSQLNVMSLDCRFGHCCYIIMQSANNELDDDLRMHVWFHYKKRDERSQWSLVKASKIRF